MKVHIRKLFPSFLIAMVSSFMLFIYEPLVLYATNTDDFWFDAYMMLEPNFLFAILCFIAIVIFFSFVYFINKHFSDKLHIYKAIVLAAFIALVVLYIHGNFLAGNLPSMDGTEINWNSYTKENIISCVTIVGVTSCFVFFMYKFKYDKVMKVYNFIMFMILCMLSTSLVSVITKDNVWNKKNNIVVSTTSNINRISDDTNFLILLVDAVDSTKFNEILENNEHKDMLNDFSYYPDTMSVYRFTRDTIPFLFSDGTLNKNEDSFETYYNNSFNNSKLISELKSKNYSINIYEPSFCWDNKENQVVNNIRSVDKKINKKQYIREIAKYDLFKYLPYPLKRFSHIDRMSFENCKIIDCGEGFSWDDKDYYELMKNNNLEKINDKYFSFIHVEGAHVPFNYDENLNDITGSGSYDDKIRATITVINEYLNRLKEAEVYDNSAIIIMADHGYDYVEGEGRQNPILYIKGINEHHDRTNKSDKPVSFTDFNEIYSGLLNGKESGELLDNIDYNRKRIFLWYEYNDENHMIEYEQTGKAWDERTLIKTGKEYNR